VREARRRAGDVLSVPPGELDDLQKHVIQNLAATLKLAGNSLAKQRKAECLTYFQEAIALYRHIGNFAEEATTCHNLGLAYIEVPALRNLDEAERWLKRSLELSDEDQKLARGMSTRELGWVYYERFLEAGHEAGAASRVEAYLSAAAKAFCEALELIPEYASEDLGTTHNQLGNLYDDMGETDLSLQHYQKAIRYSERADNRYLAGLIRENVAVTLTRAGRVSEARLYAQSALRDLESCGPGAIANIEKVRRLIATLLT
jgi:tetratricopeptide (TPR) repeat protein